MLRGSSQADSRRSDFWCHTEFSNLQGSRYVSMDRGGTQFYGQGSGDVSTTWCDIGGFNCTCSSYKDQTCSKERTISFSYDHEHDSVQQAFFKDKVQDGRFERVVGYDWAWMVFSYYGYESWFSSLFNPSGFKKIFWFLLQRCVVCIQRIAIWFLVQSYNIYSYYWRSCALCTQGIWNVYCVLYGRWDNCSEYREGTVTTDVKMGEDYEQDWYCQRTFQRMLEANTESGYSRFYCGYSGPEIIYSRVESEEVDIPLQRNVEQYQEWKDYYCKRRDESCRVIRVIPEGILSCKSVCERIVQCCDTICDVGQTVLVRPSNCIRTDDIQFEMVEEEYSVLEWKTLQKAIYDCRNVFRCISNWFWWLLCWAANERFMEKDTDTQVQHLPVRDISSIICPGIIQRSGSGKKFTNICRQSTCDVYTDQRWWKRQSGDRHGVQYMAGDISQTDIYAGTGVDQIRREHTSGYAQQNSRFSGLGVQDRFFQESDQRIGSNSNSRLVRQPFESQDNEIRSQMEMSRCFLCGCICNRLEYRLGVGVCSICSDPKDCQTCDRVQVQSSNSVSSVEKLLVVQESGTDNYEKYRRIWDRFSGRSITSCGTSQEPKLVIQSTSGGWNVDELVNASDFFIERSVQESTKKNYKSYQSRFAKFCVKNKIAPPVNADIIRAFLMTMWYKTPSGKNCQAAVSALSKRFKEMRMPDPCSDEYLKLMVHGMINISPVSRFLKRDPFPIHYLKQLICYGSSILSLHEYYLIIAFGALALRTFARGSEMSIIKESQWLVMSPSRYKVSFDKTKKRKNGRTVVVQASGNVTCPILLVDKWLKFKRKYIGSNEFLFCRENGTKIDTTYVNNILSKIVIKLGWQNVKFTTHSFRIGAASEAAFCGFSRAAIQALGDWSSDAVDRYLREVNDGNVTVQMGL
jgi:hypothetical protein